MNIEGKVVRVIDRHTVAVNVGSVDGVEESHLYGIYKESDQIEDPDTGEELGKIEYKIAEVMPIEIKKKLTTMQSRKQSPVDLPPPFKEKRATLSSKTGDHVDKNVEEGDKIKFLRDLE